MDCQAAPTLRSVQAMRIPVLMFDFGNVVGFFDYLTIFHRFGLKLGLSSSSGDTIPNSEKLSMMSSELPSKQL